MKKIFVLAAAALVALTACTKIETNETPLKKISFAVADYTAQTKADPEPEDPVALNDETTSFSTKAWLHANNGTGANFFGTSDNSYTETVSYTGSTWEPSLEYFWPKSSDSYINFVSWYGTNDNKPTIDASAKTMTWGTSGSPLEIKTNDNFLFADVAWRYKDNNTSNTTPYYHFEGVTSGVPTLFHHALAKLAFNVRLSTQTASTKNVWKVDIKNVTIKVGNKGYLPLVNEDPTTRGTQPWKVGTTYSTGAAATSANIGWIPATGTETIVETTRSESDDTKQITLPSTMTLTPPSASSSSPATSGDFQSLLAERTVMPQTINGGVVTFAMTFTIKIYHKNGNTVDTTPYSTEDVTIAETNLYSLVNAISAWNMNTKVTYNVTIDPVGQKVLFDPAVAAWATVTNGDNGTQVYPQP